jgi:hypothetical protein
MPSRPSHVNCGAGLSTGLRAAAMAERFPHGTGSFLKKRSQRIQTNEQASRHPGRRFVGCWRFRPTLCCRRQSYDGKAAAPAAKVEANADLKKQEARSNLLCFDPARHWRLFFVGRPACTLFIRTFGRGQGGTRSFLHRVRQPLDLAARYE